MTLVQIDSPALKRREPRPDPDAAARAEAEAVRARSAKWAGIKPDRAQIYLENRCNLKCSHCYESEQTHPAHQAMDLPAYKDLLQQLAKLGVLYVTFTGGEPFLRRDLLDIVAEARRQRFHITLFTSGTLINEAKADRLAELKVNLVEISLYSHDPAIHDGFTQIPGSWKRSVTAIKLLIARGIEVVLKANIMRFNVDGLDELMNFAGTLGADFQLDPTVKPKMNGDRSPLAFGLTPDEVRTKVLNRPDLFRAFRRYRAEELCTGEASLMPSDSVLCGAARNTVSIGADGGVSACGFFPSAGGNLREKSFEEIWFGSAQFDAIRSTTLDKMNSCPTCELNKVCSPCMAYSEVETGNFKGCSTPSKQLATAMTEQIRRRVAAEEKLARNELPIVGDRNVPLPDATARPRLSTEP